MSKIHIQNNLSNFRYGILERKKPERLKALA